MQVGRPTGRQIGKKAEKRVADRETVRKMSGVIIASECNNSC
jgi:hypothetical protein